MALPKAQGRDKLLLHAANHNLQKQDGCFDKGLVTKDM